MIYTRAELVEALKDASEYLFGFGIERGNQQASTSGMLFDAAGNWIENDGVTMRNLIAHLSNAIEELEGYYKSEHQTDHPYDIAKLKYKNASWDEARKLIDSVDA
jgi:hypothetical protein